jgi:hypothetical protein
MVVKAANTERKSDIAKKSLKEQGRTDSWFTKKELMAEYKRLNPVKDK